MIAFRRLCHTYKYLPLCCNEVEMREAAAKICRDFLHGSWKSVSPKELDFRRISGGLSNFLYYVALPDKQTINNNSYDISEDSLKDKDFNEEKKSEIRSILGRSFSAAFSNEEPKKVLIRIYGQTQNEHGVDNIIMDSVIFTLLSERRLGPKLHGVFSGGRIEEYIAARTLLTRDLSEPALSMKIAEKMAAIHTMDVPLCKEPQWLWKKLNKWLKVCLQHLDTYEPKNKTEEQNVSKLRCHNLEKEVEWLKAFLSSVDSPVVFCHNDLQEGNILLREEEMSQTDETNDDINVDYSSINHDSSSDSFVQNNHDTEMKSVCNESGGETNKSSNFIINSKKRKDSYGEEVNGIDDVTNDSMCSVGSDASLNNGEPKLVLIDYEYCSYNHRGFDIANHFVEWAYDYTNPEYPFYYQNCDHYPTLEQKEVFMKQYLWKMSGSADVPVVDVDQLNSEVEAFSLASHLFWTLWAVVNAAQSQIPFGYWDYAVSRMEWYNRLKLEIIKNNSNNGNPQKRKIKEMDI